MFLSIIIEVFLICELITANNFWHYLISQVFPLQAIGKMALKFYERGSEETKSQMQTARIVGPTLHSFMCLSPRVLKSRLVCEHELGWLLRFNHHNHTRRDV